MVSTRSHPENGTFEVGFDSTGQEDVQHPSEHTADSTQNGNHDSSANKRREHSEPESKKRKSPEPEAAEEPKSEQDKQAQEPPAKKREVDNSDDDGASKRPVAESSTDIDSNKLSLLLDEYSGVPLAESGIDEPEQATPETLLAHLLHALLTSARISHKLAARALRACVDAHYHELDVLRESSFEERVQVLTDGGYARYRERMATQLGALVEWLDSNWQGDLNNLRIKCHDDPKEIKQALKGVNGIGDMGVCIFAGTVQALWPCLAPSIDARNVDSAHRIGLSGQPEDWWEILDKDAAKMARLNMALSAVRLDGKEEELQDTEVDEDEQEPQS